MNPLKQYIVSYGISNEILKERLRQIFKLGWTPEHDDDFHNDGESHTDGELARAAAVYALYGVTPEPFFVEPGCTTDRTPVWPGTWDMKHHPMRKQTGRRDCLIRAAALCIAEVERLDRASARVQEPDEKDDSLGGAYELSLGENPVADAETVRAALALDSQLPEARAMTGGIPPGMTFPDRGSCHGYDGDPASDVGYLGVRPEQEESRPRTYNPEPHPTESAFKKHEAKFPLRHLERFQGLPHFVESDE